MDQKLRSLHTSHSCSQGQGGLTNFTCTGRFLWGQQRERALPIICPANLPEIPMLDSILNKR